MKVLNSVLSLSFLYSWALGAKIYHDGDALPIRVKPLTFGGNSYDQKLYLYPVDYYNKTLDNCSPVTQNVTHIEEDKILGFQSFFNNNFKNAPMNTSFNSEKDKCILMCDRNYNEVNVTVINDLIKKNYKLNFYIDDMPVGRELYDSQTGSFYIDLGVPVGYLDAEKVPHYFNHFQFIVYYESQGLDYELVYATVSTQSLTRIPQVPLNCMLSPPMLLRYNDHAYNGNRITYSVIYKDVEILKSVKKWDLYKNDVVKPFLSKSLLFIFFILICIIAGYTYYILRDAVSVEKLNVIHKKRSEKLSSKSESTSDEEVAEVNELYDLSWPSLANDVFRLPPFSTILYCLISLGFEAFIIFAFTVIRVGFGFNAYSDDLFAVVVNYFYVGAIFQSAFNAYLMKLFQTLNNSHSAIELALAGGLNSLLLPVLLATLINETNNAYKLVNSPINIDFAKFNPIMINYISITAFVYIVAACLIKISNLRSYPEVNQIPKKVTDIPITFKLIPNSIITGIFPFGVILIPLSTIYLTLWYNHFFSNNSFTLIIQFSLLVTLIISINVLNLYYLLCIGNWKWQWKSFVNGSSIGLFSFIYTFYLTKFRFGDYSSFLIALLQNISISLLLALMGGFLSFAVSFITVKLLYTNMFS